MKKSLARSGRRERGLKARLAAYSAAAAAVAAGAPAARAVGENVGPGLNFSGTSALQVHFSDGTADFQFGSLELELAGMGQSSRNPVNPSESHSQVVRLVAFGGNFAHSAQLALPLNPGDPLTGWNFTTPVVPVVARHSTSTFGGFHFINGFNGPLKSGGTAYFAFKEAHNDKTYYGWLQAKVTVNGSAFATSISLKANPQGLYGAFMSTDDPDFGTFRVGEAAPTPEPSTEALGGLGLLALGAMGVRELRRRRAASRPLDSPSPRDLPPGRNAKSRCYFPAKAPCLRSSS